jgi:epoxyqueuosine reductase
VSRYAWGQDYHKVAERRAKTLAKKLEGLGGTARFWVDYGPPPDRAVAERAGVGWFGKNTNLLTGTQHGSWVFLAEVFTDLDLVPDPPLKKSCGRCSACIPSCPTGAIIAPYTLDNGRCISYHTIENRGVIPREFRPLMGDWVFGCDLCQDACPVNGRAASSGDPAFAPNSLEHARPDLEGLLDLTEGEFRHRYQGSPIRRAGWAGLLRNACIALGNSRSPQAVPALAAALGHPEPLVRGHAAWALGRIGGEEALAALRTAADGESDTWVLEEVRAALTDAVT